MLTGTDSTNRPRLPNPSYFSHAGHWQCPSRDYKLASKSPGLDTVDRSKFSSTSKRAAGLFSKSVIQFNDESFAAQAVCASLSSAVWRDGSARPDHLPI